MITTPRMWALRLRIATLEWYHQNDPGDYMVEFELNELIAEYNTLKKIQQLGLRCIEGGQLPSSSTAKEALK